MGLIFDSVKLNFEEDRIVHQNFQASRGKWIIWKGASCHFNSFFQYNGLRHFAFIFPSCIINCCLKEENNCSLDDFLAIGFRFTSGRLWLMMQPQELIDLHWLDLTAILLHLFNGSISNIPFVPPPLLEIAASVLWCDWQSILAGEPPDPAGCLLDPGHRGAGDPPGPTHPHTQEHFLSVKSMIPAKVIPWEKPNMLQLALGRTVSEGFRHSAFSQYGWREDFSPKIYRQISCKYCCLDVECGL